jgi:CBS domain containing-hemolysin-like protein
MDMFMIILSVALFIMIVLSSFFSMSETAFTSVSVFRLKEMAAEGNKKAARALDVISDFDQFISVTLLSNNAVNITGTTVSTILFTILIGEQTGDFVATVFMLVIILIFGELLPKSYAKKNALKVCLATARVYQALEAAIWPISWWLQELASRFGKEETEDAMGVEQLSEYIDGAEKAGTLDSDEAKLLRAALVFDRKTALQVCTPRDQIVYIRADEPVNNFLDIVAKTRYSRIVVVDNDLDHPIGIAYVKDYISLSKEFADFSLRNLIRPAIIISDDTMVDEAFEMLRRKRTSIAVLRSKEGKTTGVMTIEDALESLVGDIDDEEYIKEAIGIGS